MKLNPNAELETMGLTPSCTTSGTGLVPGSSIKKARFWDSLSPSHKGPFLGQASTLNCLTRIGTDLRKKRDSQNLTLQAISGSQDPSNGVVRYIERAGSTSGAYLATGWSIAYLIACSMLIACPASNAFVHPSSPSWATSATLLSSNAIRLSRGTSTPMRL